MTDSGVRVLLVSDLHYDLRKLDWLLTRVADPSVAIDVAVLAGDMLDIASSVPLDTQITVVLSYLERLAARVPTVVCSGNHDLDSRTDSGEKTTRWLTRSTGARGRRRRRLARPRRLAADGVRMVGGSRDARSPRGAPR